MNLHTFQLEDICLCRTLLGLQGSLGLADRCLKVAFLGFGFFEPSFKELELLGDLVDLSLQ